MALGSEEKVITPQFVLRESSTGELVKISVITNKFSRDAAGNLRRRGEIQTPRFDTLQELGTLIEMGPKTQSDYFLVTNPEKDVLAKDPFAIYVKRVPKPENYDSLADQGKIVAPTALTEG